MINVHRVPDTDLDRARGHQERRRPRYPGGIDRHTAPDELTTVGLDLRLRVRVVRNLLLEEAGCADRRSEAGLVGIDINGGYVAFRARPRTGRPVEELAAELRLGAAAHGAALFAEHDGDIIGLSPRPPRSATAGVVGVGPPATPDRLIDSFPLASRAMDAAIAFDLPGVHAFGDLGLLPAIVADTEIGDALWRRYVRPLGDLDCGAEVVAAVRTWFGCGMHVDRAAAKLTLHPNTLRNRIARFEAVADVDLRDAATAMQVWWALHYGALAENRACRAADLEPTA